MPKLKAPELTKNEIRKIVLQYFYDRNDNSRSSRTDKTGVAAKISVIRRELKLQHNLSQTQIQSNLTYLLSQGWVEEEQVAKEILLKSGMITRQVTSYFKITAAGIDKIEGPGEFTMKRFGDINIKALGQNLITIGDGNQIDSRHEDVATSLAQLKKELLDSDKITDEVKVATATDIDTIQTQLLKPSPNRSVIQLLWPSIEKVASLAGLLERVTSIASKMGLLSAQ